MAFVLRPIKDQSMTDKKAGAPSSHRDENGIGQQGSQNKHREGKQDLPSSNGTANSMDDAGNSRDANQPGNKTAKKNEQAGQ